MVNLGPSVSAANLDVWSIAIITDTHSLRGLERLLTSLKVAEVVVRLIPHGHLDPGWLVCGKTLVGKRP